VAVSFIVVVSYIVAVSFIVVVSYIVAVSFIGGGNRSSQRKPPICCKSLTNYHIMLYRVFIYLFDTNVYFFL
jgi:hypothetical protein